MAGIYLSKCEAENGRRDFHLGDIPLSQIAGMIGSGDEVATGVEGVVDGTVG